MIGFTRFDVEEFRERIRKMSDEELKTEGKFAARVWDSRRSRPDPGELTAKVKLDECRAEWRRRHPSTAG